MLENGIAGFVRYEVEAEKQISPRAKSMGGGYGKSMENPS